MATDICEFMEISTFLQSEQVQQNQQNDTTSGDISSEVLASITLIHGSFLLLFAQYQC
jgi:hypothetical protein